jgi:ketosteroid isomerase-like protein
VALALAAIFAEDAVLIDAGVPEPVRGREAIRGRAADLLAVDFWDVPGLLGQLGG